MLDEAEWAEVLPPLREGIEHIKQYRKTTGATVAEAKDEVYERGSP